MKLHYEQFGDGPPLMMLHGLFGSGRNWHGIARQLADRFRIYTIDARNHGRSPHADTMDYNAMAADVRALAADLGHPHITLLGHSMGGKTAMHLALLYPDFVDRLIIVDIAPVQYPLRFFDLVEALHELPLATIARRSDADTALSARIPDKVLRLFLLQNLVHKDGHFSWRVNLPVIRSALHEVMGTPTYAVQQRFAKPALFVRGGLSNAVLPEHQAAIQARFPAAQVVTIAQAGHLPHAERPGEFLAVVKDFLASTTA